MPPTLEGIDRHLQLLQAVESRLQQTEKAEQAASGPSLVDKALETAVEWGPSIAKGAAATGINMAGAAGGAALGTAAAPFLGPLAPAAPVAGASLGSLAARKANVALGLEEEGSFGDLLSAGLPLANAAAGKVVPFVASHLPGVKALLNREAVGRVRAANEAIAAQNRANTVAAKAGLREISTAYAPEDPRPLYEALDRMNPPVATGPLRKLAETLRADEHTLPRGFSDPTYLRQVEAIAQLPEQLPYTELHKLQQRVGELIDGATRGGGQVTTGLRRLYGGFYDAFDQSDVALLRTANEAKRAEYALQALDEMLAPGRGIKMRGDGLVSINAGTLSDQFERRLQEDPLFAKSLPPAAISRFRELIKIATKVPDLPREVGTPEAVARNLSGVTGSASLAYALGASPQETAVVSFAASMAPVAIRQAILTKPGRAVLEKMLKAEGGLSPQTIGLLTGVSQQLTPGLEVTFDPLGQGERAR